MSRSLFFVRCYCTSERNKQHKKAQIHSRSERTNKPQGEYLYGTQPVLAALLANRRQFFDLYLSASADKNKSNKQTKQKEREIVKKIEELYYQRTQRSPIWTNRGTLNRFVGSRPHQGVVLDTSPLEFTPLDYLSVPPTQDQSAQQNFVRSPLWIALDEIQDPQNFGAILRSCTYFGVDGVVTSEKARCPLTPTVSKASAGAMEFMTIHEAGNFIAFLQVSKEKGWKIIGTTSYKHSHQIQDSQTPFVELHSLSPKEPYIIIFGNEGTGIRKKVRQQCDLFVTIPPHMSSTFISNSQFPLDSLNVSVAAAIILYHLRKT